MCHFNFTKPVPLTPRRFEEFSSYDDSSLNSKITFNCRQWRGADIWTLSFPWSKKLHREYRHTANIRKLTNYYWFTFAHITSFIFLFLCVKSVHYLQIVNYFVDIIRRHCCIWTRIGFARSYWIWHVDCYLVYWIGLHFLYLTGMLVVSLKTLKFDEFGLTFYNMATQLVVRGPNPGLLSRSGGPQ